jgi:SepF-like predicted cell division protein (DUF552 family)
MPLIFLTIVLPLKADIRAVYALVITYLVVIVPLFIVFLYAPKFYTIDDNNITIKKYYGHILIPKVEIEQTLFITPNELKITYRKFASGGFFGYYGLFATQKLGNIHTYAGNLSSNLVLIQKNDGKKYLITPKEICIFKKTLIGKGFHITEKKEL